MSELSPRASGWVESVTGQAVTESVRLLGGMSSEVHRLWFEDGETLVVREITNREWMAREPLLIAQEAAALELLAESPVPAPLHVGSDFEAGLLLMTFLPGVVLAGGSALGARTDALADTAATIASVDVSASSVLRGWREWVPAVPEPPHWGDRRLWQTAIDVYRSRTLPDPRARSLLHRDLHPLNVLWQGDEICGVVDWVNACTGHPHAELGHCRWNLTTLVGLEAADAFLARYRLDPDSEPYDAGWDLAAALGLLPGPLGTAAWQAVGRLDLTLEQVIAATEVFITSALERLEQ